MLTLQLLGGFAVTFEEESNLRFRSDKGRGLLAFLAAEPDRPHSRDSLATLLWGDFNTSSAKTYLRTELSNLRKLFGNHPAISISRQAIMLNSELASIDTVSLEQTIGRFLTAAPAEQQTLLDQAIIALENYQGEFLAGFDLPNAIEFSNWRAVKQEQLHTFAMRGHDLAQDRLIAAGRLEEALQLAHKHLVLERWHEPAHRRLIKIYGRQDKRVQAIGQYDKLCEILAEELGLEPEAQTVELIEKIKAGKLETAQTEPSSKTYPINKYKVLAHLEMLPDQKLFGVDEILAQLQEQVISAERPWLIALDGLGGSGKTTLANALIHQLLDEVEASFEDVAWVSAKQEEFVTGRGIQQKNAHSEGALDADSLVDQLLFQLADGPFPTHSSMAKRIALTQIVKEKRCLIVVDNLETAADYLTLLPLLRQLAGPSKFLITSRITLHNESYVFCHSLGELAREDVFAFLSYEARKQGITALLTAGADQYNEIYNTVGGNPLALKLVIGQVQYLPLNEVLATLRQSEQQTVDQIYQYIYWQAWGMLNENGRKLLLTLPIYPNGTFDQISAASGLDRHAVRVELNHLRSLSLVQSNGDLAQPRYRIHRLTETFLMHEILKWRVNSPSNLPRGGKDKLPSRREGLGEGSTNSDHHVYFNQKVALGLTRWHGQFDTAEDQAEVLRREKEGILKSIQLGFSIPEAWPLVKSLIEALTSYMERMGHWDEWLTMLDRGIAQAQQLDDLDGELLIAHYRGRILQRQGKAQELIQNYGRVIRLARQSENEIAAALAATNLGFNFANRKKLWRAEKLCCYALEIFQRCNHKSGEGNTLNHLGIIYRLKAEWASSESYFKQALNIWENDKNSPYTHHVLSNLGLLYSDMQQPQHAISVLNKALELETVASDDQAKAIISANLSEAYCDHNETDLALQFAEAAETVFKNQMNFNYLFSVWEIKGQIYSKAKQAKLGRAYLNAAQKGFSNFKSGNFELPEIEIGI